MIIIALICFTLYLIEIQVDSSNFFRYCFKDMQGYYRYVPIDSIGFDNWYDISSGVYRYSIYNKADTSDISEYIVDKNTWEVMRSDKTDRNIGWLSTKI